MYKLISLAPKKLVYDLPQHDNKAEDGILSHQALKAIDMIPQRAAASFSAAERAMLALLLHTDQRLTYQWPPDFQVESQRYPLHMTRRQAFLCLTKMREEPHLLFKQKNGELMFPEMPEAAELSEEALWIKACSCMHDVMPQGVAACGLGALNEQHTFPEVASGQSAEVSVHLPKLYTLDNLDFLPPALVSVPLSHLYTLPLGANFAGNRTVLGKPEILQYQFPASLMGQKMVVAGVNARMTYALLKSAYLFMQSYVPALPKPGKLPLTPLSTQINAVGADSFSDDEVACLQECLSSSINTSFPEKLHILAGTYDLTVVPVANVIVLAKHEKQIYAVMLKRSRYGSHAWRNAFFNVSLRKEHPKDDALAKISQVFNLPGNGLKAFTWVGELDMQNTAPRTNEKHRKALLHTLKPQVVVYRGQIEELTVKKSLFVSNHHREAAQKSLLVEGVYLVPLGEVFDKGLDVAHFDYNQGFFGQHSAFTFSLPADKLLGKPSDLRFPKG